MPNITGIILFFALKNQEQALIIVDAVHETLLTIMQILPWAFIRAQKCKEESELESVKGENIIFRSRGRTSASISKSESVKSAIKSMDTSALDRFGSADESMDDPSRIVSQQDTGGKPKSKRMKTGSNIKKNKPEADDLEKEKRRKLRRALLGYLSSRKEIFL